MHVARVPCVFAFQEMETWPCEDMSAAAHQVCGSATGSTALLLPVAMSEVCQVGRPTDVQRTQARLLQTLGRTGATKRSSWTDGVAKIVTDGRLSGPAKFYIAGDLKIQMGFDDVKEEVASPCETHLLRVGCKNLHCCLRKAMWQEIMDSFECCATSIYLSCAIQVVDAYTYQEWSEKGALKKQLDNVVGPGHAIGEAYKRVFEHRTTSW